MCIRDRRQRLREMAFLTKNLRIILTDKRPGQERTETFHYEGGIKEFVQYLNKSKEALYENVIYCEGERDGVYVEAVSYTHLILIGNITFLLKWRSRKLQAQSMRSNLFSRNRQRN